MNYRCKCCGGTLKVSTEDPRLAVCENCGTVQSFPMLQQEDLKSQYERAMDYLKNADFDKAISSLENLLKVVTTDAELYWSLCIATYGIEYVDDPKTSKKVPTTHRILATSIFDDYNYKKAIEYATPLQEKIYEEEAHIIDGIQRKYHSIASKEEPYDVFICYKESDANGRRTKESIRAQELYNGLINEGFRVFYSRITLEDKLGEEYEPYIFAALNSAKVMVVIGCKKDNYQAVWVKNEWSRFLKLKAHNTEKIIIPCYEDMDAYDLPLELQSFQCLNMSNLGFMQDLIRNIKKIVGENNNITSQTSVQSTASIAYEQNKLQCENNIKRAKQFLSDDRYDDAIVYVNKALDLDAELPEAYLILGLSKIHCKSLDELKKAPRSVALYPDFPKAMDFAEKNGDMAFKNEIYKACTINLYNTIKSIYCSPIVPETLHSEEIDALIREKEGGIEFGKVQEVYADFVNELYSKYNNAQKQNEYNECISLLKLMRPIFPCEDGKNIDNTIKEMIDYYSSKEEIRLKEENQKTYRVMKAVGIMFIITIFFGMCTNL